MPNINIKDWSETEGRTRWITKGIMANGKKYICRSYGIKQRKENAVKEIYTNGKWRTV